MVAHTLAKLVPLPSSPIVYFPKNLPRPLEELGLEISCVLLFLFNENSYLAKKKKVNIQIKPI